MVRNYSLSFLISYDIQLCRKHSCLPCIHFCLYLCQHHDFQWYNSKWGRLYYIIHAQSILLRYFCNFLYYELLFTDCSKSGISIDMHSAWCSILLCMVSSMWVQALSEYNTSKIASSFYYLYFGNCSSYNWTKAKQLPLLF